MSFGFYLVARPTSPSMVVTDVCTVNIDLDSVAIFKITTKGVVHEYHHLDKLNLSNPQLVISVDA